MAETSKTIIKRWFQEVWNEGRLETIDELYDPDARMMGTGGPPLVGREAFRAYRTAMNDVFDEFNIEVLEAVEKGEVVFLQLRLGMTHKASGRRVMVDAGGQGRIRDGRIIEARNFIDFLDILEQCGLAPQSTLTQALGGSPLRLA